MFFALLRKRFKNVTSMKLAKVIITRSELEPITAGEREGVPA